MLTYSPHAWPWRTLVADAMGVGELETSHLIASGASTMFRRETDQSSDYHQKFYGAWPSLAPKFERFVREVVRPHYSSPIVYQRIPTFRLHFPGNISVGEFHRDRDYNHSEHEENFWVPLSDAKVGRTISIELVQQSGLFFEVPVDYGQILWFDGSNLLHGSKPNLTTITRASFDFRVLPEYHYSNSDRLSINSKMEMKIGGYFARMD
jgi:hypothetical protein